MCHFCVRFDSFLVDRHTMAQFLSELFSDIRDGLQGPGFISFPAPPAVSGNAQGGPPVQAPGGAPAFGPPQAVYPGPQAYGPPQAVYPGPQAYGPPQAVYPTPAVKAQPRVVPFVVRDGGGVKVGALGGTGSGVPQALPKYDLKKDEAGARKFLAERFDIAAVKKWSSAKLYSETRGGSVHIFRTGVEYGIPSFSWDDVDNYKQASGLTPFECEILDNLNVTDYAPDEKMFYHRTNHVPSDFVGHFFSQTPRIKNDRFDLDLSRYEDLETFMKKANLSGMIGYLEFKMRAELCPNRVISTSAVSLLNQALVRKERYHDTALDGIDYHSHHTWSEAFKIVLDDSLFYFMI